MAGVTRRFVFGREKIPDWFDAQISKGRAKIEYDLDTREIVGATLFTPTKTVNVVVGDTIAISRSGMSVISKADEEEE
nr:MAG TPA: hypothetical protein [Bacteriophage sp.]